jgi:hypothetical protein
MATATKITVPIRLYVHEPPLGVHFSIQFGKDRNHQIQISGAFPLVFDFEVKVQPKPDGAPNFMGPFSQGSPDERFFYLRSGVLAGDTRACFNRRAKIYFKGIDWPLIHQIEQKGGTLALAIQGKAKDSGPICASVRQHLKDWNHEP